MASLSGGEQARVLIARLMLQPADLLLLDEPTNDLDIPTLEVLEESLTEFPGALVLVTHDRYLLDRVSTAVLGLDGQGGAQLYADYWQWEQAASAPRRTAKPQRRPPPPKPRVRAARRRSSPTWKRANGSRWKRAFSKPSRNSKPSAPRCNRPMWCPTARACMPATRLQDAEAAVDALYARWAELEAKQQPEGR